MTGHLDQPSLSNATTSLMSGSSHRATAGLEVVALICAGPKAPAASRPLARGSSAERSPQTSIAPSETARSAVQSLSAHLPKGKTIELRIGFATSPRSPSPLAMDVSLELNPQPEDPNQQTLCHQVT